MPSWPNKVVVHVKECLCSFLPDSLTDPESHGPAPPTPTTKVVLAAVYGSANNNCNEAEAAASSLLKNGRMRIGTSRV